ncbi:MAG: CWC16 protein, partial [Piptocephalis tieghemiana]
MSERKVLNKYFPPDFDPALLTRKRKGKGEKGKPKQITVRLMAPFSMRCETCGSYIYKGKKFNARKEDAKGEKYHSIQIYRFYIRCPTCAGEITFKTDPEHLDYQAEHGAVRNFEPWREAAAEEAAAEEAVAKEEAEGGPSAMEALEARTAESRREMEILDALDGIRARNARSDRANAEAEAAFAQARKEVEEREKKGEEEEKEEVVDTVDLLRSRRKGPSSL